MNKIILENEIKNLYKIFKKYKLKPNFHQRCSSVGNRQEIAKILECTPLEQIQVDELAFYCFKATYTMGDEDDLKYFLPRFW
ncbi:hypothetical protein GCM10023206_15890 [Acinetobacter puyangensis]|uniref:Uncharacterized protein n=1 Tax=Acinetobacter puyangensis TaxID=1096779 RepID=A0A240E8X4_9GAMM|nr:hypothetical protein [Acinetobacter puyangensis]SNX44693.1 hypothetical protein SAMN05421731_10444 [Acinetobacter puyangensis]